MQMRCCSRFIASTKARRLVASLPSTAAGSGIPQYAVIGWPGNNGQTSPAALSHTVMTKSTCGESGRANSSQVYCGVLGLVNGPSPAIPANGLTCPTGWLPALHARSALCPDCSIATRPESSVPNCQCRGTGNSTLKMGSSHGSAPPLFRQQPLSGRACRALRQPAGCECRRAARKLQRLAVRVLEWQVDSWNGAREDRAGFPSVVADRHHQIDALIYHRVDALRI